MLPLATNALGRVKAAILSMHDDSAQGVDEELE